MNLRTQHSALLSGHRDVITWRIATDHPDQLFCFVRKNKDNEIIVVLNFSDKKINYHLHDLRVRGEFVNVFTRRTKNVSETFTIDPWGYKILAK